MVPDDNAETSNWPFVPMRPATGPFDPKPHWFRTSQLAPMVVDPVETYWWCQNDPNAICETWHWTHLSASASPVDCLRTQFDIQGCDIRLRTALAPAYTSSIPCDISLRQCSAAPSPLVALWSTTSPILLHASIWTVHLVDVFLRLPNLSVLSPKALCLVCHQFAPTFADNYCSRSTRSRQFSVDCPSVPATCPCTHRTMDGQFPNSMTDCQTVRLVPSA